MRELWGVGERVHVEPQVFDPLLYLIERRGTVVAKEDTLDDGRAQRVIRTVHGHGYSFVAELE